MSKVKIKTEMLKEAIAEADVIKEFAIATAKSQLAEEFTPQIKSAMSKSLQTEEEIEDEELEDELEEEFDEEPVEDDEELEMEEEVEDDELEGGEEEVSLEDEDELELEFEEEEDFEEELPEEDDEELELEIELDEEEEEIEDEEDEELELEAYESLTTEDDHLEEIEELKEALKEHKATITYLTNQLSELNLMNAKLHYIQRINAAHKLTESAKKTVLNSIDDAETVQEATKVYKTLRSTLGAVAEKARKTRKVNESASRPVKRPAKKKEIISENTEWMNRNKKLAGLK